MTSGVRLAISCLLVPFLAGCQGGGGFNVPASDPTPPKTELSLYFDSDVEGRPNPIELDNTSPAPPQMKLTGEEVILVYGRASDSEGIKEIEIWIDKTGYGLSGAAAANRDSGAGPGRRAKRQRFIEHRIDVKRQRAGKDSLRIDVWASSENAHGTESRTPTVSFEWP
jgi:hypothetical protein